MKNRSAVYDWLLFRRLTRGFFPGSCALCQGEVTQQGSLCAGCRADLPDLVSACRRCAVPLPQGGICGHCLRQPPPFSAAFAAFHYQSPISNLLIQLKFHGRLALARPLGELLAEKLSHHDGSWPEVIAPVPLHPKRLRERGYNQALELARPLERRLGIPVAPQLGIRLRATGTQSNLDLLQRRRNVRDAFGVSGRPPASVAILDDVITTGSTVAAFAKALHRAGAKEIQVWALARAAH